MLKLLLLLFLVNKKQIKKEHKYKNENFLRTRQYLDHLSISQSGQILLYRKMEVVQSKIDIKNLQ